MSTEICRIGIKNPEFEEKEFLPRRLSYWPPDLGQYRGKRAKPWLKIKEYITLYPVDPEKKPEYTDTPEYPPLNDFQTMKHECSQKYERLKWYKKIRQMPTVEEKMHEITEAASMPCSKINCWSHMYNFQNLWQNITRTNIIKGLPPVYDQMDVSELRNKAMDSIVEAIRFHQEAKKRRLPRYKSTEILPNDMRPEYIRMNNMLQDALNVAIRKITETSAHLVRSQIDQDPNITSFWYAPDLEVPNKKLRWTLFDKNLCNQPIQLNETALVNIRNSEPIAQFIDPNDGSCNKCMYTESTLNPHKFGHRNRWNRMTSTAGFWPETEATYEKVYEFPYFSLLSLHKLQHRERINGSAYPDTKEAVEAMGLMYSFGWLNSMAFHHGFSPYDEVTYPFTTQTVLTDGQYWTFMAYQMNTHAFHSDLVEMGVKSSRKNMCWTSERLKLYESFGENGEPIGLNHEVVDLLLKVSLIS